MFEVLVREASARFALGDKGLPLLEIVLYHMTGQGARGLAEFLEQFKAAGLGPTVQSWLGGGPVAKPISNEELDRVLGGSEGLISTLTDKLELDRESVTSALGYLLPSLVGKLTPGGSLPSRIPEEIQALAAEGKRRLEAPASRAPVATASGGVMRWLPWVIVALAVVLALGYCSTRDRTGDATMPDAETPAAPATPGEADTAPAADVPPAASPTPGDDAARTDHDGEQETAPAPDEPADAGSDAAGNDAAAVGTGPAANAQDGAADEADGDSATGADTEAGDASDADSADMNGAGANGADAGQGESAASSVQAEVVDGKPVVRVFFESGDATVPADFADRAQALNDYLEQHPDAGIDVSGYTDASGSAQANEDLARQRAQAVQAALILMGVGEERIALEKPQQAADADEDAARARRVEVTVRE